MRYWYYVEDNQKCGPVSEDALVNKFEAGDLPPHALVWTVGMGGWTQAVEVDGLLPAHLAPPSLPFEPTAEPPTESVVAAPPEAVAVPAEPLPDPQPLQQPTKIQEPDSKYQPSGPEVRPWIRYWAKTIDLYLFAISAGGAFLIVYPSASSINSGLLGLLLICLYVFVEPIMLSTWGSTPGRSLLKIRLRREDGCRLGYREALVRAAKVWVKGLGLGFPIIALFTLIAAASNLSEQKTTSWDREGGFRVTHQTIGLLRGMVAVLLVMGCFALAVWGKMQESQPY